MTKTEEFNLKGQILEEVKIALKEGIDNDGCAVFRVMRKDQYSPKGKAFILEKGYYENILNDCNLCGACGANLCSTFQKAKQVLALKGKEASGNKLMLKNLKETGNIYGVRE